MAEGMTTDSNAGRRSNLVTRRDQNGVAVLTLMQPPRNGLEPAVVAAAQALVDAALQDPAILAVVITGGGVGAGGGFASGADLRRDVVRPDLGLSALCRTLEDARKPTVAAIHGHAIGPGLELALACHVRVAQADTQFSLPDIALGWLPAAGGIQRLTRIVGGRAAMSALLGGRAFGAPRAERLGLLDIVTHEAPVPAAVARALKITPRPTCKRLDALIHAKTDLEALAAERAKRSVQEAKTRAPAAILDCIEAALTQDMATGFRLEARLAAACAADPAARALRAVFLARRDAARPVAALRTTEVSLQRLGLWASGDAGTAATLGARAARAGLEVALIGPDAAGLRSQIDLRLKGAESAGHLTTLRRIALVEALQRTRDPEALAECDVVWLDQPDADLIAHLRPDAVCLIPAEMPAPRAPQCLPCRTLMMPRSVLELCPTPGTSPEARALGLALARRLDQPVLEVPPGQRPVVATLEAAWLAAADHLLLAGASPAQIDAAFAQAGWREGPYVRQDRLGLESARAAAPATSGARIAAKLIAAGHTGAAVGQGYYLWDAQGPVDENPLARAEIAALQDTRVEVGDSVIVPYCAAAISNCAARILGVGGVARTSDLDVAAVFGLGWPRETGGPIWAMQDVGLGQFLSQIWGYSAGNAKFWEPAPLLEDAVAHMRETLLP
jgi:3-hydroxyacyl-CoA dehydrogenase